MESITFHEKNGTGGDYIWQRTRGIEWSFLIALDDLNRAEMEHDGLIVINESQEYRWWSKRRAFLLNGRFVYVIIMMMIMVIFLIIQGTLESTSSLQVFRPKNQWQHERARWMTCLSRKWEIQISGMKFRSAGWQRGTPHRWHQNQYSP